ncbi:uncharacterized protein LOC135391682 [Ornithodoros turicata]|uniref:uncharacterized protein LOC135391682 n=1 Tax=Ornithodoros turicata TaxID=34597 RepID=UPI003138704B
MDIEEALRNHRRTYAGGRGLRRTVVCNCASYCYFSLAIVLFSLGTVLTILVLDDSDKVFPNLTHMWLIGPIFISSGLMFAVKTIMYLRRETMLAYLSRQHSFLRELQLAAMEPSYFSRSLNGASPPPPPYDVVVREGEQRPLNPNHTMLNNNNNNNVVTPTESSPPSYEEAMLLSRTDRSEEHETEDTADISKDVETSDNRQPRSS